MSPIFVGGFPRSLGPKLASSSSQLLHSPAGLCCSWPLGSQPSVFPGAFSLDHHHHFSSSAVSIFHHHYQHHSLYFPSAHSASATSSYFHIKWIRLNSSACYARPRLSDRVFSRIRILILAPPAAATPPSPPIVTFFPLEDDSSPPTYRQSPASFRKTTSLPSASLFI